MIMFVGIGLIFVPLVDMIYVRINCARDAKEAEGGVQYSDKEFRELGDRAPNFRYML